MCVGVYRAVCFVFFFSFQFHFPSSSCCRSFVCRDPARLIPTTKKGHFSSQLSLLSHYGFLDLYYSYDRHIQLSSILPKYIQSCFTPLYRRFLSEKWKERLAVARWNCSLHYRSRQTYFCLISDLSFHVTGTYIYPSTSLYRCGSNVC